MRELSSRRALESDGSVLSAARVRLWELLFCAARSIRHTGTYFQRLRLFFIVFGFVAGEGEEVFRSDGGTVRDRGKEFRRGAGQQRRVLIAIFCRKTLAGAGNRAGGERCGRGGEERRAFAGEIFRKGDSGRAGGGGKTGGSSAGEQRSCTGAGLERFCGGGGECFLTYTRPDPVSCAFFGGGCGKTDREDSL